MACHPVIPSSTSWIDPPSYDKELYKARAEVECTFNLLEQARRFATRYGALDEGVPLGLPQPRAHGSSLIHARVAMPTFDHASGQAATFRPGRVATDRNHMTRFRATP
jgi:transposase